MESDPAAAAEESDVNFPEGLADKGGQETAPITGPTSATTAPLEGLFQAGFLGVPALLGLSTELTKSRDEEEEDGDDDGGGEGWRGSESAPRTTWAHGEGRFFRGNLGLLVAAAALVGEWWLEEESAAVVVTIAD